MIKDYFLALLEWCGVKILLWNKPPITMFKEGELWWCCIGMNVGVEIFGKGKRFARPVLVFKKFNAYSFLGIPLSTQQKQGSWYVPIIHDNKERMAILCQIKTYDSIRLTKRIGTLSDNAFSRVKQTFLNLYGS